MIEGSIFETFELPSKGQVYDELINPKVTLRSMTTLEEMKRLSPTETPYKVMSDIIEDCMQEKPPIRVYDMCIGDYQFLLHKIRIVTYGTAYKMLVRCNDCNTQTEVVADLSTMDINEWSEDLVKEMLITLPKTNKLIEMKFQSPRDLDLVGYRAKELKKKTKQNVDYSILFTLMSLIKKVDGAELNDYELQEFVKALPNRDANYLLNKAAELAGRIGVANTITVRCPECGAEMVIPFRITSEFFGPTTD